MASQREREPSRSDDAGDASPPRTVTVITGDRLCTHCGYNLTGQTITRDPHYGLLVVRCPECSQVASATEYPMLGRWANRWAAVLAALYLFFCLALLSATVGSIFGLCYAAGEFAGQGMGQFINDEVNNWAMRQAQLTQAQPAASGDGEGEPVEAATGTADQPAFVPPAPTAGTATIRTSSGQVINLNVPGGNAGFQQWWPQQNRGDLIARAGGWWMAIDKEAFFMWIPLSLVALAAGCMWAVIALRRRLLGKLTIAAINLGLVAALCIIPMMIWLTTEPGWYWSAGAHIVGPQMLVLSFLWTALWMVVGLLIGRPLTRGLMNLFLPPRLRSSMAALWIADGKPPPRPT